MYIYILLYATTILLMHDVLAYIGLINVHHHFYQHLGNISEHQHGIWSYNTIDLRFQKLNLTPKIFPMPKKHVTAGFTPSLPHGKNVPLFNIRCLQINDPSFANKMFKISVISYTHIGATYKPFQHTNPSNTHPCTSVVLATPFFQLESLKTRLAGHLV